MEHNCLVKLKILFTWFCFEIAIFVTLTLDTILISNSHTPALKDNLLTENSLNLKHLHLFQTLVKCLALLYILVFINEIILRFINKSIFQSYIKHYGLKIIFPDIQMKISSPTYFYLVRCSRFILVMLKA